MRTWEQGLTAIKAAIGARTNIGAGNCKLRTREAFGIASNGTSTAAASWAHALDQHVQHDWTKIPANVFVWWTGGSKGAGHVGVHLGGGLLYTPGGPSDPTHWCHSTFTEIRDKWGLQLAGWTYSIDGKTPTRPTVKEAAVAAPVPPKVPSKFAKFAHLMPYRFGNSVAGLTKGRRLGYVASDTDIRPTKDGIAVAAHWGTLGGNGEYHHKSTGKKANGARRISTITWKTLADLRSSDGRQFWTAVQMIQHAKALGYERLELEAKAAISLDEWKRIKTAADHVGLTIHAKTLLVIPGAYNRLKAPHSLGIPTILSATGFKGTAARRLIAVTTWTRGGVKWNKA